MVPGAFEQDYGDATQPEAKASSWVAMQTIPSQHDSSTPRLLQQVVVRRPEISFMQKVWGVKARWFRFSGVVLGLKTLSLRFQSRA